MVSVIEGRARHCCRTLASFLNHTTDLDKLIFNVTTIFVRLAGITPPAACCKSVLHDSVVSVSVSNMIQNIEYFRHVCTFMNLCLALADLNLQFH